MSEHTKGRLSVEYQNFEYHLETEDEATFAKGLSGANARRLAACWNALEYLSTDQIEAATASRDHELNVARALLREVRLLIDENAEECNARGLKAYEHPIHDHIRNYLDACDTLEGAPNAG